jgi:hypothetical protein
MTGTWETTAKNVSVAPVSLAIGSLLFGTLGWADVEGWILGVA